MEITPDKKKLLMMVDQAVSGELALPEFQRNFVWAIPDVTDLLLSVFKGYFIGTFLLLRTGEGHSPFGARTFAGIPNHRADKKPLWLVLDGQQRLTSLHYVFAAPGIPLKYTKHPYRFFLRLDRLLDASRGELPEDLFFCERVDYSAKYLEQKYQFENHILPLTEVRHWSSWQNAYERWLIEKDKDQYFERYHPTIKPAWDGMISALQTFSAPVIEIPMVADNDDHGVSEICAIFEKLNSTGVKLSVYDLLTARLYKYGIYLHDLWDKAVESHPQLEAFSGGDPDVYGLYVLRTLALMRGQEVRSKMLINLVPENFKEDWGRAADAIEAALERLIAVSRDGFGVFDGRWQPYSTLVPALAVVLGHAEEEHLGHQAYGDIKCWYWGSVFMERYAGAVESTTHRDTMDLLTRQADGTHAPEVFADIRRSILENAGFSLRREARINSIYKGVMNLIAINGARDFQSNDAIPFHELEDHHIFPQAFLRDHLGLKGDAVNTILNKTLITAATNRRISRKAPSEYMREVIPAAHREAILRSHLIGPDAQAAMERDDYEAFLVAREKDILEFLKTYLEPAK